MGGFGSFIGPAVGLASKAAGGGSSGSGGLSPQQAALAAYTQGQNILKNNAAFASEGMGLSTNKSFANAGAVLGGSSQAAGISDAAAAAQQQANQANQSSLQSLASGFGTTQGSFGNTGGNTGGSTDTSTPS
jgi:hypothetical protein